MEYDDEKLVIIYTHTNCPGYMISNVKADRYKKYERSVKKEGIEERAYFCYNDGIIYLLISSCGKTSVTGVSGFESMDVAWTRAEWTHNREDS